MDLRGQQTATAGEAVSNRHVINVKDESGKKVRGFFFVKTSASIEQDFNARISLIQIEEGYEKLDRIRQAIVDQPKKLNLLISALGYDYYSFAEICKDHNKFDFEKHYVKKAMQKIYALPADTFDGDDDIIEDYLYSTVQSLI